MKRVLDYSNRDLTFVVCAYQDYEDLKLCIKRLRGCYEDSTVIVVSDGDSNPAYRNFNNADFYLEEFGFSQMNASAAAGATVVHYGERLFEARHGGEYIHRILELYEEHGRSAFLFRIDTDTQIHRRFSWLPDVDGCFGTLQDAPRARPSLQGGCVGFSRSVARRLLGSQVFTREDLKITRLKYDVAHTSTWVRNATMKRRVEEDGMISFDWILGHVASRVEPFDLYEFEEVKSLYKRYVENTDLRFAVTHPSHERCQRHGYKIWDHPDQG